MLIPSNNLVKLAIGAGHSERVELANQLFYPIAVDIQNPAQPLMGGPVGNRGGRGARLAGLTPAPAGTTVPANQLCLLGNTAAYAADFSPLSGDPLGVVKVNTASGPIFTLTRYDGSGIITIDQPTSGGAYASIPRYVVKADGTIFDCLEASGTDQETAPGTYTNLSHWKFAADTTDNYTTLAGYTPGLDATGVALTPNNISERHYTRAVGAISFRAKSGASSGVIQEQLQRVSAGLDTMSRILRSFHEEAKSAFANIVVR
jgi:hypothetical protein